MTVCYIFDIPIYRCAESKYDADREKSTAKQLDTVYSRSSVSPSEVPDTYKMLEEHFREKYGGPWQFNEIIGWLRLFAAESCVGGHLWWVHAKRIQRKMRKTFYLSSLSSILGTYLAPEKTSAAIFDTTLAQIERISTDRPFKGRYVDLAAFRNIGPFINWRELLNGAKH